MLRLLRYSSLIFIVHMTEDLEESLAEDTGSDGMERHLRQPRTWSVESGVLSVECGLWKVTFCRQAPSSTACSHVLMYQERDD